MPNGSTPQPNQVDMSVIQAAIDRRRAGGAAPALEQQTGAAAGPVTGATALPSPTGGSDTQAFPAQRAAGPAPETTTPTTTEEESPDETRIIVQMLLKRLQKLL